MFFIYGIKAGVFPGWYCPKMQCPLVMFSRKQDNLVLLSHNFPILSLLGKQSFILDQAIHIVDPNPHITMPFIIIIKRGDCF